MTEPQFDPLAVKSGFLSRHEWLIFRLVTLGLLATAAFLHFCKLASVPPGFHGDESSFAYNAWCIAQTGADEYGVRHPVFFRAFGDYKDALVMYTSAPLLKLFGLHRWVARLTSGVYLLIASVAFAFLVQEYCANKWLSVVAGFVFSLLPWVFVVSRVMFSLTPMLATMTTGWLLSLLAMKRNSIGYAIAAGVAWALAMYSYSVGRPMTVLLLLCFAWSYWSTLKTQWKVVLSYLVAWIGMLMPMIVSVICSTQPLTDRFRSISVFHNYPTWTEAVFQATTEYLGYYSPQFLFLKGDVDLRHHTGFGGELFRFLIPMILAGLYCLARFSKRQPGYRFVGLGLLISPVAAALTVGDMNGGRSIGGAMFWTLTAAIGALFLWQQKGIGRSVLITSCFLGAMEMGLYLKDVFGAYQMRSRQVFNAPFTEALEDCFRTAERGEVIYISQNTVALWNALWSQTPAPDFKPAMYADVLFFGKIDPRVYQRQGIPKERVRIFDGTISDPGVLLRCNMRYVDWAYELTPRAGASADGGKLLRPYLFDTNDEPIPAGAELLGTKPNGSFLQYEIYRVK